MNAVNGHTAKRSNSASGLTGAAGLPTIVGITGGIGSGKTTIARALEQRGYPVYYTDREAKRIIRENPMVRSGIESLFGSEVFEGDRYHTELVARQVFSHPELLERLNRMVHPAVGFDLKHWAKRQEGWCFVESAILYESGLDELCDCIVAVVADEETRLRRALTRDYRDKEQANIDKVRARIRAQMSDDELRSRADYILENPEGAKPEQLAELLIRHLKERYS